MHFIVPDICNKNGCFILVTLQCFKYSTNPNGSSHFTEKSQTLKNDWNPFLSFEFYNDWLQNLRWFSLQKNAPNFEAVVSFTAYLWPNLPGYAISVFLLKKLSHY